MCLYVLINDNNSDFTNKENLSLVISPAKNSSLIFGSFKAKSVNVCYLLGENTNPSIVI